MIFTMPPVEVAGILAWILADLCREYWVGSGGGRALGVEVDSGSGPRLGEESGGVAGGSGEGGLDTGKKEGEERPGDEVGGGEGERGLDSTIMKSFFEEGVWEQELELGQTNIGSNADRPSPSSSTPLLDTLNPSFSQSSSVPSIPASASASAVPNSALSPSSSSNPNTNPHQQQQENRQQQQQQQYPPQNPPPRRHNPHRTPIPVLGQVTLSDLGRLEEETKKGNGWIACTTDAIFLERPECYDLVVDLSSMKGCFGLDYTCGGKGRGGKAGEGGGSRLSGLGGVGIGGGGGGGGREDGGSGSGSGGSGSGRGSRVGLYMSKPKFTGGEGAVGAGRKKKSWKLESVRFTFSDVKLVCVPLSIYIFPFFHFLGYCMSFVPLLTFLSIRLIYSGQNWTGYSNSIRRFLLTFHITITIIVTLTTTIITIITVTNIVIQKVQ